MALILHAGCGGEYLPPWFPIKGEEIRLDANADVKPTPDIVATIENLGDIGPFDGVYSCHTLEHLHWHDAMLALREFHRVLKPGGSVYIVVPDVEDIKPDDTVHYVTAHGAPITGLDILFGYREYSWKNPWMMHRCGFMASTLLSAMEHAGFDAKVARLPCTLLGVGFKPE